MTDSDSSSPAKRPWFEPVTIILMGLATLGTAWSSFENSRWGSLSRDLMEDSNDLGRESLALYLDSQQIKIFHSQIFSELVNAKLEGSEERFEFYSKRVPDELKPAIDAWLARKPFENPESSAHPFTKDYYKPRHQEEIAASGAAADRAKKRSDQANDNAADHLSNTIFLSAVLFFAGTARTFDQRRVRTTVLGFAIALFIFTAVRIILLPVA